jgi:hypothetical protein
MGVYLKTGGAFQPEIFDIREGVPYAALPVGDCFLCQLNKYPEFSMLFFRYKEGSWQRVAYSEFPQQADTNLLQRIFDGREHARDAKGYIGLGSKYDRDGDPAVRGGRFKKWRGGQRGSLCMRCTAVGEGRIIGSIPDSWEPILDNGKGC